MSEHHIIYLPGLGDPHYKERDILQSLWAKKQVKVHYHVLNWREKLPFTDKLQAIIDQIDKLKSQGHIVSLVGTSAGASAAINAFARRTEKISGVVCICGKLKNLEGIGENYFIRSPGFKGSVAMLNDSLKKLTQDQRAKILSIRPIFDEIVPVKDTYIQGAKSKTIPSVGHLLSIVYSLVFANRSIIKFLKAQALLSS